MPVIEALAEEFAGRVRVVIVVVEAGGGVLAEFDADGVPAYLVFQNGVEVERLAPMLTDWWTEARLRGRIEAALANAS